jgi:hypothetical protein
MIPVRVDDGLGVPMCAVVCAWCKAPMGAKACLPHQVNRVSHGMCSSCERGMLSDPALVDPISCAVGSATAGRDRHSLVQGERLESEEPPLFLGAAPADAGSPAPSTSRETGVNAAAAAPANTPPGAEPSQDKGIAAPGADEPAALEHLSGGPAASFTYSPPPLFWSVQGTDFGRVIAWARRQRNPVTDGLRAHCRRGKA